MVGDDIAISNETRRAKGSEVFVSIDNLSTQSKGGFDVVLKNISPIENWYGVTELLVVAIPILLCAYELALCFCASIWNIGAEGQLLLGAVIATVMALQFVDSTSAWALMDSSGYNFPESALFGDSTLLPILFEGTRLHIGLLLVLLALVIVWVFMSKTFLGFQTKVLGLDKSAARMAGYKGQRLSFMVFIVCCFNDGDDGAADSLYLS